MVEIMSARPQDAAQISRLLDDYLREVAGHREKAVGATDAASYPYLDAYWSEPDRHAFFIRHDGKVVGFALIRGPLSTGSPTSQVAEFYVARDSRRLGIGREAAALIWRRFPGAWELQVQGPNAGALRFWDACVKTIVGSAPSITELDGPDGRRYQFNFCMTAT